jgi:hypothetical protein
MSKLNRWNHKPDVVPQGDEFLASSSAFPGVFGEGETREEAIDNFWEGVAFIGELARAPDWPHSREPYVDEWETLDDGLPRAHHDDPDGDDPEPFAWEEGDAWKME